MALTMRHDTMYKQEKFLIKDKVFISEQWNVFESARNLPIIGKTFLLPVSFLFSAGGNTEEAVSESLQEAIPKAMMMLFDMLEENDIVSLFQMIVKSVYIEEVGKGTRKVDIERDLSGLDELIELVASVLEQQYGALFKGKGLSRLMKSIVPMAQISE